MVRANELESPLAPHAMSLEIMELMDAIREKIGVSYPTEK
jgi:acyl carrier protein